MRCILEYTMSSTELHEDETWREKVQPPLRLSRNFATLHEYRSPYWQDVETSITNLANLVKKNNWKDIVEWLFNEEISNELSDTFSDENQEVSQMVKSAYAKFKERLLRYHESWRLHEALKSNYIHWSLGSGPEKLRMNLDYYEDLLHGKVQSAVGWVEMMNEARIEKGEKEIPQSRFTGRNVGFLVSVLRPNWPLFEDCLQEVFQEQRRKVWKNTVQRTEEILRAESPIFDERESTT